MKKKPNIAKKGAQGTSSEVIIATQSAFLFLFGVAAIVSTSAVVAGFNALRSVTSAAAVITDEGIVTDEGIFKLEHVSGIINNFQLVGIVITVFGAIVFLSSGIRLMKKSRQERNGLVRAKR